MEAVLVREPETLDYVRIGVSPGADGLCTAPEAR
jgi:hypothetical protein